MRKRVKHLSPYHFPSQIFSKQMESENLLFFSLTDCHLHAEDVPFPQDYAFPVVPSLHRHISRAINRHMLLAIRLQLELVPSQRTIVRVTPVGLKYTHNCFSFYLFSIHYSFQTCQCFNPMSLHNITLFFYLSSFKNCLLLILVLGNADKQLFILQSFTEVVHGCWSSTILNVALLCTRRRLGTRYPITTCLIYYSNQFYILNYSNTDFQFYA